MHGCSASQSYQTHWDHKDCSLPGSSVQGIFQARILKWVAISCSRGSSRPRDWTCISCVPCTRSGFFTTAPPGKLHLELAYCLFMVFQASQIWEVVSDIWEVVLLFILHRFKDSTSSGFEFAIVFFWKLLFFNISMLNFYNLSILYLYTNVIFQLRTF